MNKELELVQSAVKRVLDGGKLDIETLYSLAEIESAEGRKALLDGAAEITKRFCSRKFDSCSIVNARSGHCSENCKWCAQSSHFNTSCESYELVDAERALEMARYNAGKGVGRFSLVASGRAVRGRALESMCRILADARKEGIHTCASLGLLNDEEMERLAASGISRYHCNLETAPSFFHKLCTSHTQDDKLATIAAAKKHGLKVCSGGIIGMGETRRQRMELAVKLLEVEPVSIPINILCPIPGTPLENTPLISDEEILDTIALFRFAHPCTELRFAGGRKRLSRDLQLEAMRIGINGGVVGDLLTTVGSTIDEDIKLIKEAGLEF